MTFKLKNIISILRFLKILKNNMFKPKKNKIKINNFLFKYNNIIYKIFIINKEFY